MDVTLRVILNVFSLSEILKILLRDEPIAQDVDLTVLARQTESFSGSDLKREYQSPHGTIDLNAN